MRIVLPVHHFPPRYSAGAELYTYRLSRWLLAHGHEVEVVCMESVRWDGRNRVEAERDNYMGVPVWRLAVETSPAGWATRTYDNPELGAWFAEYLAEARPDLVHFQAGYLIGVAPLRAAVAAGIPTALTLHDFWFLCPRTILLRGDGGLCQEPPVDPGTCAWCMRLSGRAARLADRLSGGVAGQLGAVAMRSERQVVQSRRATLLPALALASAVVAPSHFLGERFRPYIPAERLHVLRYGLDTANLRAAAPPPGDGPLRLGYIGQIAHHKGVHILVDAVKQLAAQGRPVELIIHGDAEQHKAYSQKLKAQIGGDPRIRLAGRFNNAHIAEILAPLDATIVPSIWYENSPLAIMEAQAAGRPVLTSALGGMAELVADEVDGLHFRPGDAGDLARQIQRLRTDPGLIDRLRQGVRPPQTIDQEMSKLTQIYAAITPHFESASW